MKYKEESIYLIHSKNKTIQCMYLNKQMIPLKKEDILPKKYKAVESGILVW